MPKPNVSKVTLPSIDRIKELAIIGMFSDDRLMEAVVLKGGNAMDLIYKISARASVDLDFSLRTDFEGGVEALREAIEASFIIVFRAEGLQPFDFKVLDVPKHLSDDLKHFWGGYSIEFKLVDAATFDAHRDDIATLRKLSINLGKGPKFLIDVSRFECLDLAVERDFQGYSVFVYSETMIVAEKLRAICQQLPEYGPIVKRFDRPGVPRARDFVDIYVLIEQSKVAMTTAESKDLLRKMFAIKKVPIAFLGQVESSRSFHATNFDAVAATLHPGVELRSFDYYFDFVLDLVRQLQPFGDK